MEAEKKPGSIVVSADGDVILLTELDVVDLASAVRNGHLDVALYDRGIFLRGERSIGSVAHIPSNEPLRVVAHVSDVLRLLKGAGVDLESASNQFG